MRLTYCVDESVGIKRYVVRSNEDHEGNERANGRLLHENERLHRRSPRRKAEYGEVPETTAFLYCFTAWGASVMSLVCMKSTSVGASGALMGLVGADLVFVILSWSDYPRGNCMRLMNIVMVRSCVF